MKISRTSKASAKQELAKLLQLKGKDKGLLTPTGMSDAGLDSSRFLAEDHATSGMVETFAERVGGGARGE